MKLEDITQGFPPNKEEEVGSETYFYGAANNIASKLNLPRPSVVKSHWMHGWHPTLRPDVAFYFWSEHHPELPLFTWTRTQQEYINEISGKSEIAAVGAPYLYSLEDHADEIERVPDSLLIMPPHNKFEDEEGIATTSYRKEVMEMISNFEHVAACIHYLFIEGSWGAFFKDLGIPYFSIGTLSDINFHNRQRCVFRRFETMTTTTLGSHVPYAAFEGCRVSVFGEGKRYTVKELEDAAPYKGRPELVKWALDEQERILSGEVHGHLFCHPSDAIDDPDWAREELGFSNIVEEEVLARRMGFRWASELLDNSQKDWIVNEFGEEAILPEKVRKSSRAVKKARRKLKRLGKKVMNLKKRAFG